MGHRPLRPAAIASLRVALLSGLVAASPGLAAARAFGDLRVGPWFGIHPLR